MDSFDLERRHGDHLHFANIKFGWITLAALAGYLAVAALVHTLYLRGKTRSIGSWLYGLVLAGLWLILVTAAPEGYLTHFSVALKRTARVAYAMIPLSVALAWRLPPLNYLGRLRVHKWAGWIMTALTTFHGVGFLFKWYVADELGAKLSQWRNLAGLLILLVQWALVVVLVFNLTGYTAWYWIHNAMVLAFTLITIVHAQPGVMWLGIIACVLIIIQYATHWTGVSVAEVLVLAHPGSLLVVARIPTPKPVANAGVGQHIRLASHWYLPLHPYTVAHSDTSAIELVVSRTKFDVTHAVTMRGAYRLEFPQLIGASAVTVCCGGLGLSMALSVLTYFPEAKVIWCVRLVADLHVLAKVTLPPPKDQLAVYITQKGTANGGLPPAASGASGTSGTSDGGADDDDDLAALMMEDLDDGPIYIEKSALNYGRPQWSQLLTPETALVVVGCGPASLVDDVGEVLRHQGLQFVAEPYQM